MVYVETLFYVAVWGKNPRGYGGWWFEIGEGDIAIQSKCFSGTYGVAKKAAKKWAAEKGARVVSVLS